MKYMELHTVHQEYLIGYIPDPTGSGEIIYILPMLLFGEYLPSVKTLSKNISTS